MNHFSVGANHISKIVKKSESPVIFIDAKYGANRRVVFLGKCSKIRMAKKKQCKAYL